MSAEPNFEGWPGRYCGEHRTVGPHRAWCFDCTEWCYSATIEMACPRCLLPHLVQEREDLRRKVRNLEADAEEFASQVGKDGALIYDLKTERAEYKDALARQDAQGLVLAGQIEDLLAALRRVENEPWSAANMRTIARDARRRVDPDA